MIRYSFEAISRLIASRAQLMAVVRYTLSKTTSGDRLGILWWFLEPIIFAAIFYFVIVLVFSRGGPDYHFYLVSGLFAWQIFANTVMSAAGGMINTSGLIKQGAVQPLVAVVAPFFTGIFRGSIAMLLILPILPYPLSPTLLLLPVAIILQAGIATAIGICFAPLVCIVPDVRRLMSFAVRIGWFMTPVLYPLSRISNSDIPSWGRQLYMSNPVVHTISFFRYAFEGTSPVPMTNYLIVGAVAVFGIFLGLGIVLRFQNVALKYL